MLPADKGEEQGSKKGKERTVFACLSHWLPSANKLSMHLPPLGVESDIMRLDIPDPLRCNPHSAGIYISHAPQAPTNFLHYDEEEDHDDVEMENFLEISPTSSASSEEDGSEDSEDEPVTPPSAGWRDLYIGNRWETGDNQ